MEKCSNLKVINLKSMQAVHLITFWEPLRRNVTSVNMFVTSWDLNQVEYFDILNYLVCASVRPSIRCLPFVDLIRSVIGLTHSSAVFTGINESRNSPSTTPATTVCQHRPATLRNRLTTTGIQMEIQPSDRALQSCIWKSIDVMLEIQKVFVSWVLLVANGNCLFQVYR